VSPYREPGVVPEPLPTYRRARRVVEPTSANVTGLAVVGVVGAVFLVLGFVGYLGACVGYDDGVRAGRQVHDDAFGRGLTEGRRIWEGTQFPDHNAVYYVDHEGRPHRVRTQ
jgi:hypothetical protein